MSVYSGFATRQQQKRYNECIEYALSILTKRLYRFYTGQSCNQRKFIYLLTSIQDKMQQLQQNKYLTPHFSHILTQFLNDSAEILDSVSQLSKMKQDDPFNKTFSKLGQSNFKIKFNTLKTQNDNQSKIQQRDNKEKLSIIQNRLNFKGRIKTNTPQNISKQRFFTPPKQINHGDQSMLIRDKSQKQEIFTAEKPIVRHSIDLLKKQRTENNLKSRQLSPRQFLRQTVKGKQSFGNIGIRTKQKHQRIVKL